MQDSKNSSEERAVFRALLFSGDTESRAWNLLYRVLIQLKFVSDGTSVVLLALHEQREDPILELVLRAGVTAKMKSDFVQWHISQSDRVASFGARFVSPSEADKFHSCFQQLLADVQMRQKNLSRPASDTPQALLIPHPSVRPSSALQLSILLPSGRRRTETASHSTRLRELLSRVCQAERLPPKYHFLKPDKLRLDPEPAPLDMNLTLGEVKVSKLQLVDRRAERDPIWGKVSFPRAWGPRSGETERDRNGQITLLHGTFKKSDLTELPSGMERQGVRFVSPTRVSSCDPREGAERVESPVDSLAESELAAPFRDVFRQEFPRRSSSMRDRLVEEKDSLDRALLGPASSFDASVPERPASLSRVTFSESDIRGVVSDLSESKPRPNTPNRRRAPKPPRPKPPESLESPEGEPPRGRKSFQVPLFKVSQEVSCKLQDEFSVRLSALRARSPDLGIQSANENTPSAPLQSADSGLGADSLSGPTDTTVLEEVLPLASSTPDRAAVPVKPKPQIAPKPSHLLSRLKPTERPPDSKGQPGPSFPLYPSTPPPDALLISDKGTFRGVSGRVAIWRRELGECAEDNEQQLVFHPQTTDSFEQEPLIFSLPPPPPDSPPHTPPPLRYSPETDLLSEQVETDPLLPPPPDELLPSSPPSKHAQYTEPDSPIPLPEDEFVTDIDAYEGAEDHLGSDVISLEELIVLPPPHFSGSFDFDLPSEQVISYSHAGADYPPPSPLRLSLLADALQETLWEPPPPTEGSPLPTDHTGLPEDSILDAGQATSNVGLLGFETRRVTELLTAAANSLNRETEGSDRPTEASELVRAALELIATQPKSVGPERVIRASYHHSEEPIDPAQRAPPNFSSFGPTFQACMDDIRSENPQSLKSANDNASNEGEQTDSELASSRGSGQCDVVSAVAKVMRERRQQLENTNSITEITQTSLTDDWN